MFVCLSFSVAMVCLPVCRCLIKLNFLENIYAKLHTAAEISYYYYFSSAVFFLLLGRLLLPLHDTMIRHFVNTDFTNKNTNFPLANKNNNKTNCKRWNTQKWRAKNLLCDMIKIMFHLLWKMCMVRIRVTAKPK